MANRRCRIEDDPAVFADELLPFFHIDGKVVGFGPTELVHLELQKLFQDFNIIDAVIYVKATFA